MRSQTSPTGAVEFDTDDYPKVAMTFHGPVDETDVRWMIQRFEELLAMPTRYALIVKDVDGVRGVGAVERQMLAKWSKQREKAVAARNICAAIVLHSRVARGVFTAFTWLVRPPSPTMVFSSYDEAERWVHEMVGTEPAARSA